MDLDRSGLGNEHSMTIVIVGLVFVFILIGVGIYLDYKRNNKT